MKFEKLTIISDGTAVKKDRGMGKWFTYQPCRYCDEWISNCGFAYHKHYEMHKRKGDIKR